MSNNKITRKQMSNELNIPVRTLQRIINSIDRIEYVGSSKGGHWEIK
jgi:predicted HTH transcriptional regulator